MNRGREEGVEGGREGEVAERKGREGGKGGGTEKETAGGRGRGEAEREEGGTHG